MESPSLCLSVGLKTPGHVHASALKRAAALHAHQGARFFRSHTTPSYDCSKVWGHVHHLQESRRNALTHALHSRTLMAKKVAGLIKLQIPAGAANPSPPVGPALGQHGVNIMEFCKAFNAKTSDERGMIIPVVITVFADRSFTFITKTPPAAVLILKELGLESGSAEPNKIKVGALSLEQLERIALIKMPDLNTDDIKAAMRTVAGTASSMGVTIAGEI